MFASSKRFDSLIQNRVKRIRTIGTSQNTRKLFSQCCILSKFYIKPQQTTGFFAALTVVSYRNSTSNHNTFLSLGVVFALYLIEILHQTTTSAIGGRRPRGCILSKFYIKPQLGPIKTVSPSILFTRRMTSSGKYI